MIIGNANAEAVVGLLILLLGVILIASLVGHGSQK